MVSAVRVVTVAFNLLRRNGEPLSVLASSRIDPAIDYWAPRTMPVSTRDWLSVQMMAVFERDFPPGWLPFVHSTPLS